MNFKKQYNSKNPSCGRPAKSKLWVPNYHSKIQAVEDPHSHKSE